MGLKKTLFPPYPLFLIVSVQALLDFSIFYFLVLWVYDLIRNGRKIKKPENTKVKKNNKYYFHSLVFIKTSVSDSSITVPTTSHPLRTDEKIAFIFNFREYVIWLFI